MYYNVIQSQQSTLLPVAAALLAPKPAAAAAFLRPRAAQSREAIWGRRRRPRVSEPVALEPSRAAATAAASGSLPSSSAGSSGSRQSSSVGTAATSGSGQSSSSGAAATAVALEDVLLMMHASARWPCVKK